MNVTGEVEHRFASAKRTIPIDLRDVRGDEFLELVPAVGRLVFGDANDAVAPANQHLAQRMSETTSDTCDQHASHAGTEEPAALGPSP